MSRGSVGIYLQKHLYGYHLADLERITEAAVKDHETQGCRFAEGWQARLETMLLERLPQIIGEHLEGEEVYCPERGIGISIATQLKEEMLVA